jgi:putative ABC transport system permease protein
MTALAFKNLLAHRRRFLGTFLAAVLGVAFLAGTLVLGDTLKRNFDTLFAEANQGVDAAVRSSTLIKGGSGPDELEQRGLIDASLVDKVRAVQGVDAVMPEVSGYGQILGADGDAIGGNGPPRLAGNWITDPDLNPYNLVAGHAPRADDEVVIDQGAADDGDLHLGDRTIVQTPEPVRVKIVGLANFGSEPAFGGVTYAGFTLESAQRHLLGSTDRLSDLLVRAEPGTSQATVTRNIREVLPRGTEALTGAEYTKDANKAADFLSFFRVFLTMFAAIALLVAAFSIYNTFAIVVAQRTRESALLRAIGASRRQLLMTVLAEAVSVGVVSSVVGFAAGIGIAGLLKGVFDSFGFALPAGGLMISGSAVIVSLLVGIVVTVVAGIAPALRASRVAPVAALQETTVEAAPLSSRRIVSAVGVLAAGVALIALGIAGSGTGALSITGLGGVLVLAGAVVAGPLVAAPAAHALGAPIARLRGVTGALARENATRNPRRTASTASALIVGIAIVTLFTVFAASLKKQIDDSVSSSFAGDLVVNTPSFGGGALSPNVAGDVAKVPDVETAVGVGRAVATVDGKGAAITVANPADLSKVLDLDVVSGSIGELGPNEIAVSKSRADDHDWHVGSTTKVAFPDRSQVDVRIGAIYEETDLVGGVLVPRATYTPHAVQATDTMVLVDVRNGVSLDQAKADIQQAVAKYGDPDVQDRKEYIASVSGGADLFLGIVYVMLALAIVIALMGIANTLSLAVYERTREVGLLRAVGETRRQVRSMIRWESVIIAVFGTALGLGVGVFVGWAVITAAGGGVATFAAPVGRLVAVLAVGAVVGVVAALRPARRAARLDVMQAIAAA